MQTEIQIVIKADNLSRKEFIGGRPTKDWKDLGERSKRTRVAGLSAHDPEVLAMAAVKNAKSSGGLTLLMCLKSLLRKHLKSEKVWTAWNR